MATSTTSTSGRTEYGVKVYTVDTEEDKNKLRTTDKMGSKVYVIDTQSWYILSGKHKWEPFRGTGGSSSSGDDDELNIATQEEVDEMVDEVFNK